MVRRTSSPSLYVYFDRFISNSQDFTFTLDPHRSYPYQCGGAGVRTSAQKVPPERRPVEKRTSAAAAEAATPLFCSTYMRQAPWSRGALHRPRKPVGRAFCCNYT